jgi:hypothetical protein
VYQSEIHHDDIGYESCPRFERRLRAKMAGTFDDHKFPYFLVFDFGCGKNVQEITFNLDM